MLALLLVLAAWLMADDGRPAAPTMRVQPCNEGGRPGYFVPGGDDPPPAIIGCVRLGVSGKPVELSLGRERIGRKDHLCLNPAFRGRGQLGVYIPTHCRAGSVTGLEIVAAQIPRRASRAVPGYEFVIWGTVPPTTRKVVAEYQHGRATGAVISVDQALVGAQAPFSVFVVELPAGAACGPVELRAGAAREQIPGQSSGRGCSKVATTWSAPASRRAASS